MAADDFDHAMLFAAYRLSQVPATARRDRVLARLSEPGDRPVFLGSPVVVPKRGVPIRVVLLAAAAAVLAVLGLELLSGGLAVRFDRTPAVQAVDEPVREPEAEPVVEREVHVQRAVPRVPGPVAVPEAAPVVIPPPPAAAVVTLAPTRRKDGAAKIAAKADVVAKPEEAEPARVLTEKERELAMIADALAALDRRAITEASIVLAQHAREFPRGKLAKEREALEIVVDCRLDHGERSRLRARDFIVHTALSPHWQRIVDACRANAAHITDPFAEPTSTAAK